MRILIIFLFSLNAWAQMDHRDFNFEVDLSPNGKFETKIIMTFDEDYKFSKIITDLILNEDLKLALDENFISQEIQFAQINRNSRSYSMEMKVKRSGLTATLNSDCTVTINRNNASNICILKKSSAFLIGPLFKSSSNTLKCVVLDNKKKQCTMSLKGQTMAISGLISRTADRLAISGSAEAISKIYYIYHEIQGSNVDPITEDIYENNILSLWNQMMLELDHSDKLHKTIKVKSSQKGLEIN